ncbi:DNA/RNA-binding domain E.t1.c1-type [Penicillium coprophilum]|uniref:DNA/RNA-binding domain E.t1.c1-type n=1 Tax=Penicillium coprophilum TaxID=36646 RepID=UPI0023878731|nr:DNA/RNA-binding domain E.t1.c1-type [Penicillium coprophilum]KAJ5165147.1 DNA/RNA-binding domain E.t1.c1-type [Penicillium coprophilum]
MGTGGCCSATSPIFGARPNSTGVPGDDCTTGTLSSHGVRALRSPARNSVGHVGKSRRRNSFRVSREPRRSTASASQQLNPGMPQVVNERFRDPKTEISALRQGEELFLAQDFATRPELQRSHSTPIAAHSRNAAVIHKIPHTVQAQAQETWHTKIDQLLKQNVGIMDPVTVAQEEKPHEMFRQPNTHAITKEQLVNEVRGIYTGLVMVEKRCIKIDREQMQSKDELSQPKWQTLVSLHRTLLYEHHDFFSPPSTPRMWRYGVHSFLELLRYKLPGSMEYMLDFIYLSYSMITLLLESVPKFQETWIECLGDLARYRMAVEELDKKDREVWAGVSRYWYNQDAEKSPENGRIQHHLAVLARPDILQQLFHYTKALISVRAFPNALESMTQLVTPLMKVPIEKQNLIASFVTTHGALFMQAPVEEFVSRANVFLATLRKEISRVSRDGQQGAQMTSCNIAAIFQYGREDGVIEADCTVKLRNPTADDRLAAMKWASQTTDTTPIYPTYSDLSSQLAFQASSLAFHTLIVMLREVGDPNIYPGVHISMAFVWYLTLNPAAIKRLEPLIPWSLLASYLNTLFRPDTIISKIEDESFPLLDDSATQQLPEDFLIRGQAWSRLYYPERFFEGAPTEDERPSTEEHSTVIPRRHRCLWLGVRIATYTRWITYDQTRRFTPTRLAEEFAPIAESPVYLHGNPHLVGTGTLSFDEEMQEA